MFGFGILDAANAQTIINSYNSVKDDGLEDEAIQLFRGGDNGLFVSNRSAKAEISVDVDWLFDSDYKTLRDIMLNRTVPDKLYFRHPGYVTGSYLTPSTATHKAYICNTSTLLPNVATLTTSEFSSGDYSNLSSYAEVETNGFQSSVTEYIHCFFTFDLTSWLANGGDTNNLLRLSLLMNNPAAWRVNGDSSIDKMGIIVRALKVKTNGVASYSGTSPQWVEIYRRSITVNAQNQQCAAIRPVSGFSSMTDFIDGNTGPLGTNKVGFLLSILQPRDGAGTLHLDFSKIALMVNGFMVRLSDSFNLNWRSEITLTGRTGSLKLLEV